MKTINFLFFLLALTLGITGIIERDVIKVVLGCYLVICLRLEKIRDQIDKIK